MALPDGFLSPLGFAALLAAVPILLLYLVRPDPRRVTLPTVRFLRDSDGTSSSTPLLERLKRSALLLLQLLAIVLFATALATPYAPVSQSEIVEETVIVVDASASMNVESGGQTRFDRAISAAQGATTSTTSIVVADGRASIALRDGTAGDAADVLSSMRATDARGGLRTAITRAQSLAGENARLVVLSDFADDGWETAVQSARARGLTVDLRQFDGGGDDNVGIVDRRFSGEEVSVSVQNFGTEEATRQIALGDARETISLAPGDVRSVTLPVPASGGEIRLSPGDSFPSDDVAYVATPDDAAVDVLLVTNDENRYLTTALSVIDPVELTTVEPPDSVPEPPGDAYDVVLYSNVAEGELRDSHVDVGRETLATGGGVGIQAGQSMPVDAYGDLLLVSPGGMGSNPTLTTPAPDELTRDITFPPPERYVRGDLRTGTALVSTTDGTPIIATASRGSGQLLYYGYIESASTFKYDFEYPIFWKRSVYALADRQPLADLNRYTGERVTLENETTIETPRGQVTAAAIDADDAGFYVVDGTRYSASLLSPEESAVRAAEVDDSVDGGPTTRSEERTVPDPLTEFVALGVAIVAIGEVVFIRRRGDL